MNDEGRGGVFDKLLFLEVNVGIFAHHVILMRIFPHFYL
jgi:hypothetical protein